MSNLIKDTILGVAIGLVILPLVLIAVVYILHALTGQSITILQL